jgi:hypothetical protein
VVSGYTVDLSSAVYTFDDAGTHMVGVKFNLDKAANDVKVAMTTGNPTAAGDWADCGSAAAVTFAVTCTFAAPVADGTGAQLSVLAVSDGTVVVP